MGGDAGTGVSRIQTAAVLGRPDPRRMAVWPVDWMADMIEEGGAVPVMVTIFWGREKDMLLIL